MTVLYVVMCNKLYNHMQKIILESYKDTFFIIEHDFN